MATPAAAAVAQPQPPPPPPSSSQQTSNDYLYQHNNDASSPYPQSQNLQQQQQTNLSQQQQQQPPPSPSQPSGIPNFQPYLDPIQNDIPATASNVDQINNLTYTHHDLAYTGEQLNHDETTTTFTAFSTPESSLGQTTRGLNLRYQIFLDKITPHWKARWAFSLTALFIFMARIVLSQGWYVVCYALAIYYLNLFIGFITPKIDPSLNCNDEDEGGPMLPTHANDEFKPFIRRLPEFKFWLSATQATLISLTLTLFEIFDIPVFWPILLLYFIILTACTMRQQIKHMIKWKYVPWDAGKKKYASKESGNNLYPTTV